MLTNRLLPALLCINLALLAFFLVIDYQLIFHSDSAVKNLLAQEIYDTGRYFPRDWNYVNGDLWVFYTQTFVLAVLPFMRNGFLAHAASDLVSAALILYGTWLVTSLLQQGRTARMTGMLVISAGMSLIMAEHIFGQAAYGSMYYMGCFLLYAYWSLSQAHGARALRWGAATALLAALVFWANPQRALLFYGLPLMAAGALQYLLARGFWSTSGGAGVTAAPAVTSVGARRQALALGVVVAGAVIGILLNRYTLRFTNTSAGLTALHWLDFKGMLANVVAVAEGVTALFGGIPYADGKVVSLAGAYGALRLVGALALLVLLPWSLLRALRPETGPRQLVVVFTAASLGLNLFVMLATSLADMSAPSASVRYLVPTLMLMLLIMTGVMCERDARVAGPGPSPSAMPLPLPAPSPSPFTRALGIGALALLATSAPTTYLYPFNEFRHLPWHGLIIQTPDQQLTALLKQQGLRYGYSSFWNAGRSTVLSGGDVRVRQVTMERGLPVPMRNLASNRWFDAANWRGETFLMLRDSELGLLDQPVLAGYAGQPRVLRYGDMNVLVYPTNLAGSLPAWDMSVRAPVRYHMDARTLHQLGTLDNGVLKAAAGEQGNLHFGPMRMLAPGAYAVSFDLEAGQAAKAGGDFGTVDVVTRAGTIIHAKQAITSAGRQRLTLRFSTDHTLDMVEFRVFTSGRAALALSGIVLENTAAGATPAITAAAAAQEN
jgi:hypothetical protein